VEKFISVIIPVYNDPERIEIALNALLKQTYPQPLFEIIAIDNASTDTTPKIIESFCTRYPNLIKMAVESKIQSSYAARNQGIKQAKGDVLAFIDSDCIPDAKWIETGSNALQKENASCGGGHVDFFFKAEVPNIFEHYDAGRKMNQKVFIEKNGFAATANFFVYRSLFDKYGLFRHNLISGGDYEFGRRLTEGGEKMVYIRNAIVHHPARNSWQSIMKKCKRVAEGQKQLYRVGLYDSNPLSFKQLLPVKSCPIAESWKGKVPLLQKIGIIFLSNYCRWINFYVRKK